MGKRSRYRDHVDPDYRRWAQRYPQFPGVAECVRLIRTRRSKGAWADIIAFELAENAADCLPELIAAYREATDDDVPFYVMMALDIARPPEAIPFLVEVLREGDARFAPLAERALRGIDTREARTALWNTEQGNAEQGNAEQGNAEQA